MIDYNKKIIFVHIYKNAGTSIKESMVPHQKYLDAIKLQKLLNVVGYKAQLKDHAKLSEYSEFLGHEFSSYFSFCVVRNPYDWQASLFAYMLKNEHHYQHDLVKDFSFDDYIHWRVSNKFQRQSDFIKIDGQVAIDSVLKFERLELDYSSVIRSKFSFKALRHVNSSQSKKYRSLYTKRTLQLISDAFSEDFETFGYESY